MGFKSIYIIISACLVSNSFQSMGLPNLKVRTHGTVYKYEWRIHTVPPFHNTLKVSFSQIRICIPLPFPSVLIWYLCSMLWIEWKKCHFYFYFSSYEKLIKYWSDDITKMIITQKIKSGIWFFFQFSPFHIFYVNLNIFGRKKMFKHFWTICRHPPSKKSRL